MQNRTWKITKINNFIKKQLIKWVENLYFIYFQKPYENRRFQKIPGLESSIPQSKKFQVAYQFRMYVCKGRCTDTFETIT